MTRDKVFQMRLSDDEREKFEAAARAAGISVAAWLRRAGLLEVSRSGANYPETVASIPQCIQCKTPVNQVDIETDAELRQRIYSYVPAGAHGMTGTESGAELDRLAERCGLIRKGLRSEKPS